MNNKDLLEKTTGKKFPYLSGRLTNSDMDRLRTKDRESYDKVLFFKDLARKVFNI